jgi:hypothetical protein
MKLLRISVAIIAVLFLAIQLVPYGHSHLNPPVSAAIAWDSPQTQISFTRACGDCHSNVTAWPWYSNVAPMSWLVQRDVDEGRAIFNVSERRMGEAEDAAETVTEGEMPPAVYLWLHSDARMSASEKQAFVQGLQATFGGEGGEREGGEVHED